MSKITEEQFVSESQMTHRIVTVPNIISFVRLLLIPLFFYLFVIEGENTLGCVVFAIAAGTDWIDGQVARRTGQVSELGKILDPAVDRVLLAVGVISLFLIGRLPLWMLVLVFVRDIVLGLLTVYLDRQHHARFTVIYLGKIATAFLMTGFASLVLYWPVVPGLGLIDVAFLPGLGSASCALGIWFSYIGLALSWATGFIYLYRGLRFGSTCKPKNTSSTKP
jgi:cardiolipin synthase (CMP-forming)